MKMFRTFLIIPTLLFCAACVHVASPLPPAAKADHETAILYGRFDISHQYAFGFRLGLWLQNLDTEKPVYLYFDPDRSVYAVQVKPGHYRVAGFVGLTHEDQIRARKPYPPDGFMGRMFTSFYVAPEAQIYLGDYKGHVTYDGVMVKWGLDSSANRFTETTLEYRRKYPNLVTAPAVSVFNLF